LGLIQVTGEDKEQVGQAVEVADNFGLDTARTDQRDAPSFGAARDGPGEVHCRRRGGSPRQDEMPQGTQPLFQRVYFALQSLDRAVADPESRRPAIRRRGDLRTDGEEVALDAMEHGVDRIRK